MHAPDALGKDRGQRLSRRFCSVAEGFDGGQQLGARSLGYRLPSMHWRGPGVSANDRGFAVRITPRRMLDFARRRFLSATARTPALQRVVRSAYRRSFPAKAGGPFKLLDAGAAAGELNGTGIEATAAPRPEAMAALVERVVHDGRIRHVKDGEYLSWRFRRPGPDTGSSS